MYVLPLFFFLPFRTYVLFLLLLLTYFFTFFVHTYFFFYLFLKRWYFTPFCLFLESSSSSSYHCLRVFHWSLNDCKSPQISRTLLSILVDLNDAVVWVVLILLLISNSSNLFFKPLETVPSAPTTTGITVTLMFHNSLASAIIIIIINQI